MRLSPYVCTVQGKYELVVMAVDSHARDLLTSTTDVTVYVTDVNDNAPQFIRPMTPSLVTSSSHDVTCDATVRLPHTTSTDAVVTQVAVTSLTLTLLRTRLENKLPSIEDRG